MSEGNARIELLGVFQFIGHGKEPAKFRTNRAAEIIARVALEKNRTIERETLACELWPDADQVARNRSLRSALTYARNAAGTEHIITFDSTVQLSSSVLIDLEEMERQERMAIATAGTDDQLYQLLLLDGWLKKPLLLGWNSEWVAPFRTWHEDRYVENLTKIAQELAARSEWEQSLEITTRILEFDASNEPGIRLRLRLLGQLGRTKQAHREFIEYQKRLKDEFGLKVHPDLHTYATKVVFGKADTISPSPITGVQSELMNTLLTTMIEEEPDRVFALFASKKLNWALVQHGPELGPLIAQLMQRPGPWDANRCAVAKRLLQYYIQEHWNDEVSKLAAQLLTHGSDLDRIAAISYQGMVAQNDLLWNEAARCFIQAQEISESLQNTYLVAVCKANLGGVYLRSGQYELAEQSLRSSISDMEKDLDPNGIYSTGIVKIQLVQVALLKNDSDSAKNYLAEANRFLDEHNFAEKVPTAFCFEGWLKVEADPPAGKSLIRKGIDLSVRARIPSQMLWTITVLIQMFPNIGLEPAAARLEDELQQYLQAARTGQAPRSHKALANILSQAYIELR